MKSISSHPNSAVLVTDQQERVLRINPAFTALTGFTDNDVVGKPIVELYIADGQELPLIEEEKLRHEGIWSGQVNLRCRNGAILKGLQTTVSSQSGDQGSSSYIHIIEDADARLQSEAFDQITGLPNRHLFKQILAQEQQNAKRKAFKLGVLLIDIDNFKIINDSLGYSQGDKLLGMAAERMKEQLRGNDLLGHLGGNQFAALLPSLAHPEDASIVARKLMQALGKGFEFADQHLVLTISVGIVIYPGDGDDGEMLLKHAEKAMYHAKQQGRNDYHFFEPAIQSSAVNRLTLESEMRQAIKEQQFVLHYQPQIETESGHVIGMEALIRWQHPEKGMIPPFHFIPVAEETGLIVDIGEWVLFEACRQNRTWQQQGLKDLKVAVNISARQFSDKQLLETVHDALNRTGLDPKYLELEITESVIMNDVGKTIALLEKLTAMGLGLSIDDFGTGYSSLSYLKRFPINKLKIDKSFIDDVNSSEDDAKIVSAIIGLSHNLNLNVICEGVEDEAQLGWLQQHKCNEIQGYYFSKPLPADEFEAFVRDRNSLF